MTRVINLWNFTETMAALKVEFPGATFTVLDSYRAPEGTLIRVAINLPSGA